MNIDEPSDHEKLVNCKRGFAEEAKNIVCGGTSNWANKCADMGVKIPIALIRNVKNVLYL